MGSVSNLQKGTTMKRLLSLTAAAALAGGLLTVGATSAAAHVTVEADTTEAGSYAVLTFSVPHGCGNSPTTALAIEVPEEFNNVTPTAHPSWDVQVVTEEVSAGDEDDTMIERPAEVVYTAHEPLPANIRDAVELSVLLPDTPGETLAFPVVQRCQDGEDGWVELAEDHQDAAELEMPAPTLTLTGSPSEEPAATEGATGTDDGSSAPAAVVWVALTFGAGGLLLGGLALVRTRRA